MKLSIPHGSLHSALFRLALVFLLAFAQQAVVTHPYSHAERWQESSPQKHDKHHSKTDNCVRCLALTGLSSAIGAQTLVVSLTPAQQQTAPDQAPVFHAATALPYRSRAPPSLA